MVQASNNVGPSEIKFSVKFSLASCNSPGNFNKATTTMAASPTAMDADDKWGPPDDQGPDSMDSQDGPDAANGALPAETEQGQQNPDFTRGSSVGGGSGGSRADASYREKQVKVLRSLPVCSV